MSRSIRGGKGCGYDFWGRRPMSQHGHGRIVKKLTSGIERMQERAIIRKELEEIQEED